MPPTVEVMIGHSHRDLAKFLYVRKGCYDAIIVCRPHNMKVFCSLIAEDASLISNEKIIYDSEAIFARREIIKNAVLGTPLPPAHAEAMVAAEIALAALADMVISVSPIEAELIRSHGVKDVRVIGFSLDVTPGLSDFEVRTDILFVGAIHGDDAPNADSLRWFVSEVLPKVRSKLGFDIRVKVVGLAKSTSVLAMNGDTVDLIGEVDDLSSYFDRARLMIAPTRFAAGIPHKVHHAAAYGVPTVATDLIAEQLRWQPDRDILATSDPDRFAELCVNLYRDRELWARLRDGAMERCREDCAPAVFKTTIREIVESCRSSRAAGTATTETGLAIATS